MLDVRSSILISFLGTLTLGCGDTSEPIADAGRDSNDAGRDSNDAGEREDAGLTPDAASPSFTVCGESDPDRLFFHDFETEEVFGDDPHTRFQLRIGDLGADNFAVIPGEQMGARPGHVLRGNMYEFVDGVRGGDRVANPLAAEYGKTVWGNREPGISVSLEEMGIPQYPSADPAEPPDGTPAEVYISVYLWMDDDFTFDGLWGDGMVRTQTVKLFYAFGPNSTGWVTTTSGDGGVFFHNVNGLWDAFEDLSDGYYHSPSQTGHWRHWEFYMRSETRPLYYEYGSFSTHPERLASGCPDVTDYTIQFPVIASDPMRCLSSSEALAENSQDGVYVVRVDGEVVMDHRSLAWNARFNRFNFPAWHGGDGQPIANAGWAIDDFCVRSHPPDGFIP